MNSCREEEYEDEQQRIKRSAKVPQPIEIAFKLSEGQLVTVNNPYLFAYLPTQKETHLRFLIQARYQTTPARDNIQKQHSVEHVVGRGNSQISS